MGFALLVPALLLSACAASADPPASASATPSSRPVDPEAPGEAGGTTSAQPGPASTARQSEARPEDAIVREAAKRLERALAREAPPKPLARVQHPEGLFEAQVPGQLQGPPEVRNDRTALRFEVGAGAPVECWVVAEELHIASELQRLSGLVLEAEEVSNRQIRGVDAGAIGDVAFLALDWLYRFETQGSRGVSLLKQRIATTRGHTVFCQHDELGYSGTFARVFESLVDTLEITDYEPLVSWYREIAVISLGEARIGFTSLALSRSPQGGVRSESRMIMLLPANPRTIVGEDSYEVELATEEGHLRGRALMQIRAGREVTRLRLEAGDEALHYEVAGAYEDSPVTARLRSEAPLLASFGQFRVLREALAEGAERVRYPDWVPEMDPGAVVDVEVHIEERLPEGGGRIRTGILVEEDESVAESSMRMQAEIDAKGTTERASIPLGQGSLQLERVQVHGSP